MIKGASPAVAEFRRKAEFYRQHAERAGTLMEREYWMKIANHWRELADRSTDGADDQIN
jgi:hypothetical protein